MTVPTPREAASDGVLGFVAESLRRLEDTVARGFGDVNRQLSELPRQYVPRLELDRRFDELTLDIGEIKASHAADVRGLEDAAQAAEKSRQEREDQHDEQRDTARRWLIGTTLASATGVVGVVLAIVDHFH